MQTFRYGMVWRAMGGLPIFLGVAIPILMVLNNEKFDRNFSLGLIAFAALGIWSCLYFTKYAVTFGPDGFTIVRFARRPLIIAWREIHSAREKDGELTFRTIDNRRIRFNSYFPGYAAIEQAAVANLPAVAFGPSSLPAPPLALSSASSSICATSIRHGSKAAALSDTIYGGGS